ncbi:MAG: hypoxanthine phosphoribosyltransferase [Bacteroidales bacterium]|nr:hypoxanthine phosphoribosyltransferase [Bacteroidales bacterium]MBD5216636.1 hypoxanthine phosphoribosyltransferase [Bacteroidales bacterium]MBD5219596.1 hypoxanthine phosphoribosyltransferase [Bacteroidales bacterium]
MTEVTYEGLTFVPYITRKEIEARVAELGRQIVADSKGTTPLFICVLNGAFPFASDLFRAVEEIDAEITFVRLKSYEGTGSTGKVKELVGLSEDIKGRTVIVVEDIIDTGKTMHRLVEDLRSKEPADVKIATLLFKPDALVCPVKPDYVGFNIPTKFIIGYGLDLNGLARNLNDIYILKEE